MTDQQIEMIKQASDRELERMGLLLLDYEGQVESLKNDIAGLKEENKRHAIEFGEWLKTFFPILSVENGQWVMESQVSTEHLYNHFYPPKA